MSSNKSFEQWGEATSLVDYDLQLLNSKYSRAPRLGKDFESSPLANRLGNMPDRTVMGFAEQFNGVDIADSTLRLNAYLIEAMAHGREESKRQVWFGELALKSKSQSEHAELVAIKPMTAKSAAREYHASEAVANRLQETYGRRVTFEGLGFYFDQFTWKNNLITRYEHGVQSMDRVLWSRDSMPAQDQVIDVFSKAAETLAVLHGEATIAHGDAQPKNIAADVRGIRIIDLEEASDMLNPNKEVDIFKANRLIKKDLEDFLLGLGGDYTDLVKEYFAEPYVDRIANSTELPSFDHLSVAEVAAIGQQPQRSIPYLGPRF